MDYRAQSREDPCESLNGQLQTYNPLNCLPHSGALATSEPFEQTADQHATVALEALTGGKALPGSTDTIRPALR